MPRLFLGRGIPNPEIRTAIFLILLLFGAHFAANGREFPPEAPPPKPLILPTPLVHQFANGLKVVVIERRSLPLLTLRLVVKSGGESDPPNLAGTAQFVAELLTQGTERRSASEIAEAIDFVGGSIDSGVDWDASFAAVTVLSDHASLGFDLLADIVLHPAFASDEIERHKKQTLSALNIMGNDPVYVADTVFNNLIFAGTPYGHPLDGTEESIQRITRRDLREFHHQFYRPDNCVLAVVGDISAQAALEQAQKYFGDWAGVRRPPPPPPGLPAVRQLRKVVVIDKPDAVQTEIRAGNPAIRRDSPDYYALTVANQILGGPAANRLFKSLRTQEGLTYGASSELICEQNLGSWVAKTNTRNSETWKSLKLVLDESRRLSEPITGPELRTAQSYLIGHMALEFETSGNIASQTLELMVHDLPLDYWNRFPGRIEALTSEEVAEATRRYLDPERNVIVLVGDARTFSRELKKLGPHDLIPLADLDFASPTLRRSTLTAAH
ncbi:MAG: M16 family metallopeptidase [Terriglobia bacterium]